MMYNRTCQIENKDVEIHEKLLQRIFNKDDELVIFDIGACEGINSIRYARMFPNSKVYAIEPLIDNIQIIKDNTLNYKIENIEIFRTCLSDKIEEAIFFVSSGIPERYQNLELNWNFGNKSSSLLCPNKTKEIFPWLKFEESIKIRTNTLTNFCYENEIVRIDFIHMDVQGAELKVLNGATQILSKIKSIWLEVEEVPLYKDQPLKKDIEDFFYKNGFTKVIDTVGKVSGDQLYVKNDM